MPENPGTTGDKDLNIRVWSAEVGRLTAQAMGFKTTTMNWGDVPGAMQQGVVDGWIGGTAELNYTAFADIVQYFTPYNAFVENTGFYIHRNTWDGLTAEQQKVIGDAFAEASAKSFALSASVDEEYLKRLPEVRIEVVPVSDEEIAGLAQHVRDNVWPTLEERLGKELLDQIKSDL